MVVNSCSDVIERIRRLGRLRELGVEWYVVKPIKRGELYTLIASAMARSAAIRGAVADAIERADHPRTAAAANPAGRRLA